MGSSRTIAFAASARAVAVRFAVNQDGMAARTSVLIGTAKDRAIRCRWAMGAVRGSKQESNRCQSGPARREATSCRPREETAIKGKINGLAAAISTWAGLES